MKHIELINLKHWLKYAEKFWQEKEGISLDLSDEIDSSCSYYSQKTHLLSLMPSEPKQHLQQVKDADKRIILKWKIFSVRGQMMKLQKKENYLLKQLRSLG